jgi:hypothetical protein
MSLSKLHKWSQKVKLSFLGKIIYSLPKLIWGNTRKRVGIIADIWWVVSVIWWVVSVIILLRSLWQLSEKVDNIELTLTKSSAELTVKSFFSQIEAGNLSWAYSLFSESKKMNNSYTWFAFRLKDIVWFEWIKITPLVEKNTALSEVFLVEYWFKKRWLKTVKTIQGWYAKYNKDHWEIDYSTLPLYENWWKSGACDFYRFEHCK